MANRNDFFSYQASTPTPSLEDALAAGAIADGTTEAAWNSLTPGMRREIVRTHEKVKAARRVRLDPDSNGGR